jgi:uncharacterized alpha-E superfamily protein
MLNRVADSLFWIGRYLERAENHTRLINTIYHLSAYGVKRDELAHWYQVIRLIGDEHDFLSRYSEVNESNVLQHVILQVNHPNSIRSCINLARENMRQLREQIPSECWDILNSLFLWMNEQTIQNIYKDTPYIFLKNVQDQVSAFQGILYATMMRDRAFYFIEIGKYLERADNGLRLLHAIHFSLNNVQPRAEYGSMLALLKAVNGYESYRRVYSELITMKNVVEFLLHHPSFPRSICHSLKQLEQHLRLMLTQHNGTPFTQNKVMSHLSKAIHDLYFMGNGSFAFEQLDEILLQGIANCEKVANGIESHLLREEVASA